MKRLCCGCCRKEPCSTAARMFQKGWPGRLRQHVEGAYGRTLKVAQEQKRIAQKREQQRRIAQKLTMEVVRLKRANHEIYLRAIQKGTAT